jgi:hypothetical protein
MCAGQSDRHNQICACQNTANRVFVPVNDRDRTLISRLASKAAGSNLTKYFLNATRTQSSCEKSKSQRAESRGFSPGTPVSSHRESWQGGLGKKGPQ